MADYLYTPAEALGPIAVGDKVEMLDSQANVYGTETIKHVGKRHVKTSDGRRWTIEYGEWICQFHGATPESYPFPSIRKVAHG